jgi:lysophospholipase L1-like esterase
MALARGRFGVGVAVALVAAAVSVPGAAVGTSGGPGAQKYVALGDSFTASPLTGLPVGVPLGCNRTQNNYPRLVAEALEVAQFVDRSCGGATTRNLFSKQTVLGGDNLPQLDSITPDTTLVSLGIGGNDVGLNGLVQHCAALEAAHTSCIDQWAPGDADALVQRLGRVLQRVDDALAEIRLRAPNARVLVVGYPVVAPAAGIGCVPQLPIDAANVAYLRDVQQRLNTMLARGAEAHGVTYVDTYSGSIGHDPCQEDGVKWIEGVVPDEPGAALHPNAMGQQAMADAVLAALGHVR